MAADRRIECGGLARTAIGGPISIRRLFTDALDSLGIEWKQSNHRNTSIAKREAVARLDEFVGPKY